MLFVDAQGHLLKQNTLLQDNKSVILLETNGRLSHSKRSRYLNVRCFCIKDLVNKKQTNIECYLTEQMLADFFTKPLQGLLFQKLKAVIL